MARPYPDVWAVKSGCEILYTRLSIVDVFFPGRSREGLQSK